MSRRVSVEARVVNFFGTAPLAVVEAVFNIVSATMKTRRTEEAPRLSPGGIQRKPRAKRKTLGKGLGSIGSIGSISDKAAD